jgi:tRNA(Ile)-lysidine synthase
LLRRAPPASDNAVGARSEALFAPLAEAKGLLLAVSGGPDSTALMIMAAEWAKRPGRPKVDVATIDHGLRPEAHLEAEAVAAHARRRGLVHHLIEWPGEKPKTRLQERAREARYRLLAEKALAIGADHIVTAHHADDQNETILFRLLRGSGIAGLRGMAPFALLDGLVLARPLLGLRKAELIAYCRERGEAYFEDPSNEDPRFARTRLRRLAALLAEEGFGPDEAARLSRRAARMEEAVARATQATAARLKLESNGPQDARALFAEPQEIALRLLKDALHRAGGAKAAAIRLEQIEALADALQDKLASGEAHGATLGGLKLRLSAKGYLTIDRAPPRRRGIEP